MALLCKGPQQSTMQSMAFSREQSSKKLLCLVGKSWSCLRPDPNTGKVFPVLAVEMFGVIRDLISFRLTGGSKGMCWSELGSRSRIEWGREGG